MMKSGILDYLSDEEKLEMFEHLQSKFEDKGYKIKANNEANEPESPEYSISTGTITPNDVNVALKNSGETDAEEIKYDDTFEIGGDDCAEPLPIHITKNNSLLFTLYYNPVNPAIFLFLDEIQKLAKIRTKDRAEIIPIIRKMNEFLDAVFGDGSANVIHRHDNINRTVLTGVLNKLRQGYEEYSKTIENAEPVSQAAQIIEAKKQAAQFRPPVNHR